MKLQKQLSRNCEACTVSKYYSSIVWFTGKDDLKKESPFIVHSSEILTGAGSPTSVFLSSTHAEFHQSVITDPHLTGLQLTFIGATPLKMLETFAVGVALLKTRLLGCGMSV